MTNDLASAAAQSLNRDPMVGLRLARVDGFEPAVALGTDELPAYLRRFTMLFADDATMRRGGIGRVTRAVNAQGEAVALKQLILPTRDEFDDDVAHEALVTKFKAAFREEYECHRALSGLKGFPRLYGWGEVDGVPAIVMEWVEGETLARLRPRFAVDDAGRLSPLVAARLGRDLFDLLCRMSLVGEGFVHRDISPANIMVRTARLPLDRQLAEGTFDLCLIDFGSSLALEPASAVAGTGGRESFTERYATLRRATVAYAPPEMLTDDIADLRVLRMSPAIDVYAAASTVYELIAGVAPYEVAPGTSGTSGSRKKTRDIASPYRLKMDTLPDYPVGAHAPGCDLTQLLRREPDVALAAAEQAQQLGLDPNSEDLRDALAFVDAQLFDVVMACLSCHQEDRPEPAAVEAALSAFCDHYAQNVARSLRAEPLTPCPMDASGRVVRRAAMIGAASACGLVWAVVVVSAALLASGARATVAVGYISWSGTLPGIVAALALALPGMAGIAAGAMAHDRRTGFLHGVLALSACEVPVLIAVACTVFSQRAVASGFVAALIATYALVWFLLSMGFAFELPVAAPRRAKTQTVTPLAGGAAAVRAFVGTTETSSDTSSTTKEV
jgi:serine/threonine protein kinase